LNLVRKIKTFDEVEKAISYSIWKPTDMPRGNPLRGILRGLSQSELRSVATMLFCVLLGIRLPLFDEPNPSPFQIFKRTFRLPKEWRMPLGLFEFFPYMHEQIKNGLSSANADELERAKAVCRFLSRLLDNPENWRHGAITVTDASLPWEAIKLASLLWRTPVARASIVGLIILAMRSSTSSLREETVAAFASIAREMRILSPEST
jgi:hypothetical protein